MREFVKVYVNGVAHKIQGEEAFMQLADWLRYKQGLTGTKIVCAEGDCGACTVLVSRLVNKKLSNYKSINSCISFMYLLDRCHVITVEGLKVDSTLHPVQAAMMSCNGAQCGYCTPGFICAMAGLANDAKAGALKLDEKHVKNSLTGNLCRCTGYESIIHAGASIDLDAVKPLKEFYDDAKIEKELGTLPSMGVSIKSGDKVAFLPATLLEAIKTPMKVTSGATDLGVLSNKGKLKIKENMSLNNISSMYDIIEEKEFMLIGAKASLTQIEKACEKTFPEFSRMLHIFASPQIKNTATLVGNVINASPISDTIPFLRVAEAELVLLGPNGERTVNINDFIKGGYKELDLAQDEFVTLIKIPKRPGKFKLYKVSKRKDLDISAVTFAVYYELISDEINKISFAYGGVGPTVMRLPKLEHKAQGQDISEKLFRELAADLKTSFKPLSDVRGSDKYRMVVCQNLMMKFYDELHAQVLGVEMTASI